jgi:hypothetical protein
MIYSPKTIISKIKKRHQERQIFMSLRNVLQKNSALQNSKKGKTCFILGNGPSLNNQDLTRLANKETLVMNNFWRHSQYKIIRPKYLLFGELSTYAKNKVPEFGGVNLPSSDQVISQIPGTKLILNSVAKNFVEQNKLFLQNQVYYVLQQGPMDDQLKFNIDPTKSLPFPKNSAILGITLAVYMGFETIYLLGCEHDFLAYPAKKSYAGFRGFYDKPQDLSQKVSDDPRYEDTRYEDMIASCLKLFRNYRLLSEKIAKLHPNVKIYNATPNSFLDVFPAVNFEDIK